MQNTQILRKKFLIIRRFGLSNPSDTISGPMNTFHIQQHFTCSSVCVIYSITCTKCSILYIGETCRQLNARFGEHLRLVEEKKQLSLNIKMMTTSTFQFILTYPATQYTHQLKNCPEKPWRKKIIFELGTITSSGLNKQFSFLFEIA